MNWNKLLSGLLAIAYVAIAAIHGGMKAAFEFAIFLILPLSCIWFSDAMGGYTGSGLLQFSAPITKPSPGILIRVIGWVVLLLPITIGVIIYISA